MTDSPFAILLRRRRKQAALTQQQLAEQLGLHVNYIGLLERGEREPSDAVLLACAKALDIEPAEIFLALHPCFRTAVHVSDPLVARPPISPALQHLLDDEPALQALQMTRSQAEQLAWLDVFGEIRRTEDYVRVAAWLRQQKEKQLTDKKRRP